MSPSDHRTGTFCGRTRREFLWETGGAFTGVALAGMLAQDGFLAKQAVAADGVTPFAGGNPLAPRQPHRTPKAKSVIFLFMYGGPSQVDTFVYKPKLYGLDGKTIDVQVPKSIITTVRARAMPSPRSLPSHGQPPAVRV